MAAATKQNPVFFPTLLVERIIIVQRTSRSDAGCLPLMYRFFCVRAGECLLDPQTTYYKYRQTLHCELVQFSAGFNVPEMHRPVIDTP